ncbi:VUT family protein [Xanthobacteraceae bacterium Astr-EGSB]|uniref:VUT family protein n=1 Tax=Astrobacterium formosum TaxID=3069710 RepID=UPI0027B4F46C|nr:VUT family protein [Xanthobacteraceae bacterium Astr-EGSB]
MGKRLEGFLYLLGFIACIPLANWFIENVGTACMAEGPCLLPVWPGMSAPSGVVVTGLALVLRDLVQRRLGRSWSLVAVASGALLSALIAPPALVVASGVAFFLSESADFLIYTPLQARNFVVAVIVSSLGGLVVDSVIFLWLAFGSLDFLLGQVVGKSWMVLASIPLIQWLRARDARFVL